MTQQHPPAHKHCLYNDEALLERASKELLAYLKKHALDGEQLPPDETPEEEYPNFNGDKITYRILAILLARSIDFREKVLGSITIDHTAAEKLCQMTHPYMAWFLRQPEGQDIFESNYDFMRSAWENDETDYCTRCGAQHHEPTDYQAICSTCERELEMGVR